MSDDTRYAIGMTILVGTAICLFCWLMEPPYRPRNHGIGPILWGVSGPRDYRDVLAGEGE